MIHEQGRRGEYNIASHMDTVFCRNHAAPADLAAVPEINDRVAGTRIDWDVQPAVPVNDYSIPDPYEWCDMSPQIAGVMH